MTTIAYRGGMLAADTQATDGSGLSQGQYTKIAKAGAVLAAAAGSAVKGRAFLDWVRSGCAELPDLGDDDHNADGLLFLPDGRVVEFCPRGQMVCQAAPFYATGSGAHYALGAMARGATAEEAVQIAAAFDVNTGGQIMVLTHE